jgi:hypothetical protein
MRAVEMQYERGLIRYIGPNNRYTMGGTAHLALWASHLCRRWAARLCLVYRWPDKAAGGLARIYPASRGLHDHSHATVERADAAAQCMGL